MTLMVGLIGPISDPSTTFAEESTNSQILFTNVNIFDGENDALAMSRDVLVEGNLIKQIGQGLKANEKAIVIDGGGRTLMPGLIDGHAHVMINGDYGQIETNMDLTDLAYRATRVMERFLMDGFTSVRDMGGPTFGLQRNIDAGIVLGPRLYPSGAFISQTSGHGDFRDRADGGFSAALHGDVSNFQRFGIGTVDRR
jgi:imidazolonepropionase-like amidohydrolase